MIRCARGAHAIIPDNVEPGVEFSMVDQVVRPVNFRRGGRGTVSRIVESEGEGWEGERRAYWIAVLVSLTILQ
jgi:hypothetical protein